MRALSLERVRSVLGFVALILAVALASPGVRVTQAEEDFSYDPALEPSLQAAAPAPSKVGRQKTATVGTCAAREAGPILPLNGMPLLITNGAEAEGLNSMNSRGYNIGKLEPAAELRQLEIEVKRRSLGR